MDCIVPRHLLPCSVITCWVLRKKEVCSCDGSGPRAFQDSAGCCGVSVSHAGDTAGGQAFVLCLCSQHPLQSSQSLKRNVLEKCLPQCSSSVSFHVLRTHCCSMKTLNISVLLPSSQAAADFQLQVSSALDFSQMRFLDQVSSS